MFNVRKFMPAVAAALIIAVPSLASAASGNGNTTPQACTIHVEYAQANTVRLTYDKAFVVSPDAPFSDDFSTATRFRFFDAWATVDDRGIPVVSVSWDADINVFNAMAFQANLTVTDQTHGETTQGRAGFFGSSVGSNTATYFLTCQKAN